MKVDQTPLQVQAQLQRQLQGPAERQGNQLPATTSRTPYDASKDTSTGKGLPSRDRLSSEAEIQAAQQKVEALSGVGTREAPLGRVSAKLEVERRQPLGQIIDIRV